MSMSGLSRSGPWILTTYHSCDMIWCDAMLCYQDEDQEDQLIVPTALFFKMQPSCACLLDCLEDTSFLKWPMHMHTHRCSVTKYQVMNAICYHRCAISCTAQHKKRSKRSMEMKERKDPRTLYATHTLKHTCRLLDWQLFYQRCNATDNPCSRGNAHTHLPCHP